MATIPRYTIMREDVSQVYARDYGTARDSATILQALVTIGAADQSLVLTDDEDGVWTLTTDVTIPANVTLVIPAGVSLTGPGNLMILGGVLALRTNWFQGTGTRTWSGSVAPWVTSTLVAGQATLDTPLGIASGGTDASTVPQAQINLGIVPGTNVQPYDAALTAFANLAGVANTLMYFTAPDVLALTTLTAYSRTLLANTDAQNWHADLGLGALALLSTITTPLVTNQAITYAKIQNVTSMRVLGNSGPSSGVIEEVSIGAGLSLSGGVLTAPPSPSAPGGVNTQAQWNSSGVLAGSSGLTLNATQVLAMAFANPGAVRTALNCGTMATQNADAVNITGGGASFTSTVGGNRYDVRDQAGEQIYGFVGYVTAGVPNRWNIYIVGNAPNHIQGSLNLANALTVSGKVVSTGQLSVGVDGAGNNASLYLRFPKNTNRGMYIQPTDTDTGGGGAHVLFAAAGGATAGAINCTSTTTSYGTSSDVRLKHSIAPLLGALEALRAVRPVTFRWQSDESQDEGFLAHELMTVIPHAVVGQPDALNDDGSINPQQVDQSKLVVWLVAALQEVTTRLEALEAQL